MAKMMCTRNMSSGSGDFRVLLFKKGKVYEVEAGRFVNNIICEDGRKLPLQNDVLYGHFMHLTDFETLMEVEYMINEIGELMDDLEHDLISPKEFKELFLGSKGKQMCSALIKARKYMKE